MVIGSGKSNDKNSDRFVPEMCGDALFMDFSDVADDKVPKLVGLTTTE